MGNALRHVRGESQKNIVRFIEGLSGKYSRWDIWKTMKDHFGRKYVTEADLEKYQVQTAWNGTLLLLN